MKQQIRDWLVEQFGDDEALLAEIDTRYRADFEAGLAPLRDAVRQGDLAAVRAKAHALKGMALTVGDREMAAQMLALEQLGAAGDAARLPEAATRLADAESAWKDGLSGR